MRVMAVKKRERGQRYELFLIAAIVLFSAVFSVATAIGPSHLGDDIAYAYMSHYAAIGTFHENTGDILSVRILHILPIGFFYAFMGAGVYSSAAWDIISFVLSVFFTYLIGCELYDRRVGILAAFFLSIFPMAAIHATTMSDNIPLMMFATLAFLAFLKGMRARKGTHSTAWYVAAGAATCACGFVTPEGFVFWIIMAFVFLWRIWKDGFSIKSRSLYMIAGFAGVLGIMILFNFINLGLPLITFSSNAAYYSQLYRPDISPQPVAQALAFYPSIMFPYKLGGLNIASILTSAGQGWNKVGLFFYAFVAALLYLVARWDKRMVLPMIWFGVGLLYLQFGPMHVGTNPISYVLSHRLDRYLTLIAPPLCIVLGAGAWMLVANPKSRFRVAKLALLGIGIALLTITSLEVSLLWYQVSADSQHSELSMATYLSALPNATKIYFDSGYGDIAVYMRFDNLSRFYSDYGGIGDCHKIPGGSYVAIPRYQNDGFNYTPNPLPYCSNWVLKLSPQPLYNNTMAIAPSRAFEADLYYVPAH